MRKIHCLAVTRKWLPISLVLLNSFACGCAFGFPERSQPAPGGFRNDSGGGEVDPSNRGYGSLIQEGTRLFRQGEFAKTIELMDYALKATRDPGQFARALMIRGASHGRLFQNDLALKDLNAALQYDPKMAGAYYERGWVLGNKNEFDAAIADFDHAIQLSPKNTNFYQAKIAALGHLRRWNEALDTIRKELVLNPKAAAAYGSRARIEATRGETTAAFADADRALTLDPNNLEAHGARVKSHIRLKEITQAEEELRAISRLKSGYPGANFNNVAWIRATCSEAQLRNGKEAVSMAKKACEISHWKNYAFVDTLAAAYAEAGDFNSAVKYEQQVLGSEMRPPPGDDLGKRLELYRQHQPYRDIRNG